MVADVPGGELVARVRAYAALARRYATVADILAAVDHYWGRDGYPSAPDCSVHLAACPACRSNGRPAGRCAT